MRNRFTDPSNGDTYDWHVNHETEEEAGRQRTISHSANTSNVGLVRFEGDKAPLVLRWGGSILHNAQHTAMWDWFERCDDRTIHIRDFANNVFEVAITAFLPVRKRGENRADPSIPFHYWTYTIEMEVFRVVSGPLHGVVSP